MFLLFTPLYLAKAHYSEPLLKKYLIVHHSFSRSVFFNAECHEEGYVSIFLAHCNSPFYGSATHVCPINTSFIKTTLEYFLTLTMGHEGDAVASHPPLFTVRSRKSASI